MSGRPNYVQRARNAAQRARSYMATAQQIGDLVGSLQRSSLVELQEAGRMFQNRAAQWEQVVKTEAQTAFHYAQIALDMRSAIGKD